MSTMLQQLGTAIGSVFCIQVCIAALTDGNTTHKLLKAS